MMGPKKRAAATAAGSGAAAAPAQKRKRQPKASPKTLLPAGTQLTDTKKQCWTLGRPLGEGGFGLIYAGSGPVGDCVVKVEPKGNGPLFCEMHFYQRAADAGRLAAWAQQQQLAGGVGVPKFYGFGHARHAGEEFRFLAIERLGDDLEKQFEQERDQLGRLPAGRVFGVAVQVLRALHFVHASGYAHADVKASNLLAAPDGRVCLADFGLAYRFCVDGQLKECKEDPKRRHDGTTEFCSRDAHRGLPPSPRADVENLGWCLLHWLSGRLPWQPLRDQPDRVFAAKEAAMANLQAFVADCLRECDDASAEEACVAFLAAARDLPYHGRPDYQRLIDILSPSSRPKARARASPKAKATVEAKSPKPRAKASPRTKAKSPKPRAKASPRAKSPKPKARASPRTKAKSPPLAEKNDSAARSPEPAARTARKSGSCQTSPHLLQEAVRLARSRRRAEQQQQQQRRSNGVA